MFEPFRPFLSLVPHSAAGSQKVQKVPTDGAGMGHNSATMTRTRTPTAAVAQTAERGARNSEVDGSIPVQQHQTKAG